ncbi:Eukaryotic translation initiation factor 5A [Frankliniella fusca]|uniref:Eukaryotic translation initiation factor 5A n=1 Tax=Frankliniella fusca TaxID=407009 RepID=A0AAE1L8N2_9NEOP|nr:Eukaryotic translation initiation factor 5A [Frankliniella fusca]
MIEIVEGFSLDRKTKVFLKVSCLQDVVDEMRKKLRLPEDEYLVYQEDDGTLINDDIIFESLCLEAINYESLCCLPAIHGQINRAQVGVVSVCELSG